MLCTGIPELTHNSISKLLFNIIGFLEKSLALSMTEEAAEKYLLEKLEESLHSLSTKLNFAFHLIANK
jgi:hypothetical protein